MGDGSSVNLESEARGVMSSGSSSWMDSMSGSRKVGG